MEFRGSRVQDVSQVFDRNWQVNHDMAGRQAMVDNRKKHFDKMYNIKSKEDKRAEMRRLNSVDGQVKSLNDRMQSMTSSQNRMKVNDFKSNFR